MVDYECFPVLRLEIFYICIYDLFYSLRSLFIYWLHFPVCVVSFSFSFFFFGSKNSSESCFENLSLVIAFWFFGPSSPSYFFVIGFAFSQTYIIRALICCPPSLPMSLLVVGPGRRNRSYQYLHFILIYPFC